MSLKTERDLSASTRSSYTRAKEAEQARNYDYAISLMQVVLKEEPLFLEGRRKLRAIEIQKYRGLSTFNRQMLSVKSSASAVKLASIGKKEPAEIMAIAEEVLAADPFNFKANSLIAEAGEALGELEIKAFAYETIASRNADKPEKGDRPYLLTLAQTYMAMGQASKAESTFERILKIDPRDGDALSGLKNASAANASRSGGWETAKDYRDVIKDKSEAQQLEQQSKVVKSSDAIDDLIASHFQKHQAEPNSPVHSKAIAALLEQKNDLASAIPWFEHSYTAGGSTDSSLEKKISDMRLKVAEKELNEMRAAATAVTDPEQQAQYAAAVAAKEQELNQARLSLAETRVRNQPNDGEFRFQYGEALFQIGEFKRATEELQQSLKQPSVRYPALNLMGQSFMKRGMLDFAIKQFSLAESELTSMDELKKDIVYNLGLAYEAAHNTEKALEQWKKIYEHDLTYRDVAQRVEASYS